MKKPVYKKEQREASVCGTWSSVDKFWTNAVASSQICDTNFADFLANCSF